MKTPALVVLMCLASACNCGLQPVSDCDGRPCTDGGTGGGTSSSGGGTASTGGGTTSSGGGAGSTGGGIASTGGGSGTSGGGSGSSGGGTGSSGGGTGSSGGGTGSTGGGSASQCATLDLAACRANSACVADVCYACSCTPTFKACRGVNEPESVCPALGCPQPQCCSGSSECSGGLQCSPISQLNCGGACMIGGDCTSDTDCASSSVGPICELNPCGCPAKVCTQRCGVNNPCMTFGTTCNATSGHCEVVSCGTTGPTCPAGSTCAVGAGACLPATCTTDRDCAAGTCAFGVCQPSKGQCRAAPP